MLCNLLEIHRHFGGISVNYYQITWSHIPGFCILYEGHCGAAFRIPLLPWPSWSRCYLQLTVQAVVLQRWHCSSVPGRGRDFLLFLVSHWLWGHPGFICNGKAERGSEANHSPLWNAKLRMHGAVPPHHPSSQTPPAYVLPLMSERKLHSCSKQWVKLEFCIF